MSFLPEIKPVNFTESIQLKLDAGEVPVKEEYIIPLENRTNTAEIEEPVTKKSKGKRNNKIVVDACQLCYSTMNKRTEDGVHCGRKGCNSIHSISDFNEKKLPYLDLKCPSFERSGWCSAKLNCRCGSNHIVNDINIIADSESAKQIDNDNPLTPYNVLNKFPRGIAAAVRKHNYNLETCEYPDRHSKPAKDFRNSDYLFACKENNYYLDSVPRTKKVDFRNKLILAPMCTLGTLPSRVWSKDFGSDITLSEMTIASSFLEGNQMEYNRCFRHPREDIFGLQITGYGQELNDAVKLCCNELEIDFMDFNASCPQSIALSTHTGASLLRNPNNLIKYVNDYSRICESNGVLSTLKMRMGLNNDKFVAKDIIKGLMDLDSPLSAITIHARTSQQRYSKNADWNYIAECAKMCKDKYNFIGNGDIYNIYSSVPKAIEADVDSLMIGRGFLIKPWIFKELKEGIVLDPTSSERMNWLKNFGGYLLDFYGSDAFGVERSRLLMLEHLSFLHRYTPVGLLENVGAVEMNKRPPFMNGRDEMETLMMSRNSSDWVKITEHIFGKTPKGFCFEPKHKSAAF